MKNELYFENLKAPCGRVDVVIDTDTFTEVDDQYAIAYTVKRTDKFIVKGITVAPFYKPDIVSSVEDGIEKSYNEALKVLKLADREDLSEVLFKGSCQYMVDEVAPVESAAADFLADIANSYSPEKPLYIIAIGALTNIASAIIKNPALKENCVVVWLGGHATHMPDGADEYNMRNDIAAARVVFGCGIPLVQLACNGVVDRLITSRYELEHWLKGKNALCDYLVENTVSQAELYAKGAPWSRVIWDVTPVAWLMNGTGRFMRERLIPSPIPGYDKQYSFDPNRHLIKSVYWINRDAIYNDLFKTLAE